MSASVLEVGSALFSSSLSVEVACDILKRTGDPLVGFYEAIQKCENKKCYANDGAGISENKKSGDELHLMMDLMLARFSAERFNQPRAAAAGESGSAFLNFSTSCLRRRAPNISQMTQAMAQPTTHAAPKCSQGDSLRGKISSANCCALTTPTKPAAPDTIRNRELLLRTSAERLFLSSFGISR